VIVKTRAEELAALADTIKILNDDDGASALTLSLNDDDPPWGAGNAPRRHGASHTMRLVTEIPRHAHCA